MPSRFVADIGAVADSGNSSEDKRPDETVGGRVWQSKVPHFVFSPLIGQE